MVHRDVDYTNPNTVLRTAQVIVLSLAGGILVFGVIALISQGLKWQPFKADALLSMVMGAAGLSLGMVRLIVPAVMISQICRRVANDAAVKSSDLRKADLKGDARMGQAFVMSTVSAAGMMEGGALVNLVAFLLEGQLYSLILAGILLLGLLAGFPTRARYDAWLERQHRRIIDMRSFG